MNNYEVVRTWVEKRQKMPVKSFLPTAIRREIDIPIDDIIKICNQLEKEGLLKTRYRAYCPECFNQLEVYDSNEPRIISYCDRCNEEDIPFDKSDYQYEFIIVKRR